MTRETGKRISCPKCLRPERSCLCDLVRPVDNRIPVQLLQHPKESQHPKGSAILLQLSLNRIDIQTGEQFPELVQTLANSSYRDVLLYPPDEESENSTIPHQETDNRKMDGLEAEDERPLRLWLLDGTWRKTYKILQLNPVLQALPRFTPSKGKQGQYEIRKAPKEGQLSTLEACCHALGELEQSPEKYQPLMSAFGEFNQRWMDFKTSTDT